MSNIQTHRISAAKFDYEYLGKSRAEIAAHYQFPTTGLDEEIEDKHWSRKIAPTELPTTSDMQKFADQLEKITRSKLSIISLFRQIDNQSLYAELEKAILQKCLEAVASTDPLDDKMTTKLVNVTKTLVSIQERNPIQLADQFKEALATQGNQVVVNIATSGQVN